MQEITIEVDGTPERLVAGRILRGKTSDTLYVVIEENSKLYAKVTKSNIYPIGTKFSYDSKGIAIIKKKLKLKDLI